jgi:hypothetical protein
MARHKYRKDKLYIFAGDLYIRGDLTPINYYSSIYTILAYKDSPGKSIELKIYAPNPIVAYIALLDMGYTPVDNTIHKDLRKW